MSDDRSFRNWLIDRVMTTTYVRYVRLSDEKIAKFAKKLGVQTDVLVEARVRYVDECLSSGMQPAMGIKVRGSRHYQIKVPMPEPVFVAWKDYAERRGVDSQALLRSVLHHYLLGSAEPEHLLQRWVWKGRTLQVDERAWEKEHKGGYPFRERALITNGARRALKRRAERKGASVAALMRGMVLDVLAGKHPRVKIIDARTMYDDEERYLL